MRYIITLLALLASGAHAHEMTPTYFELSPSFVDRISYTELSIFNRRIDTQYYELSVYDKDWNVLPFASEERIIKIDYLEKKLINVYVKDEDIQSVTYICSMSKMLKENIQSTVVASRICSKIK